MINRKRVIRTDPQYRTSFQTAAYDPEDWHILNELCKRPVDTPRAKLTKEQIAEILAMPEGKLTTGRKPGPIKHGTDSAYRLRGCRCEVCLQGRLDRSRHYWQLKKRGFASRPSERETSK